MKYRLLVMQSVDEHGLEWVKDRLGRVVELDSLDFAKKCASIAERKHGPIQILGDPGEDHGYIVVQ